MPSLADEACRLMFLIRHGDVELQFEVTPKCKTDGSFPTKCWLLGVPKVLGARRQLASLSHEFLRQIPVSLNFHYP